MNTLFIGGSRHISRLSVDVKKRLENVIDVGHRVIVGDANGADKAVQRYFHDAAYDKVTVFCSGNSYRNNLGQWETHNVYPPKHLKGFHFYAAKDREMAQEADFGLMIWDGKSAGTVLNVLRLVRAGKIAVLFNVSNEQVINIKTSAHWEEFLAQCSPKLRKDIRERATADEWMPDQQTGLLDAPAETAVGPQAAVPANAAEQLNMFGQVDAPETERAVPALPQKRTRNRTRGPGIAAKGRPAQHATMAEPAKASDPADTPSNDFATSLNAALAASDSGAVVDVLGKLARAHRMTQVAQDTGLARESLYRALSAGGNPEFATVLKVLSSLGLRLTANPIMDGDSRYDQPR